MKNTPDVEISVHETLLPGCCGVHVLHEARYGDDAPALAATLAQFIAKGGVSYEGCAENAERDVEDYGGDHSPPGLLLYTLDQDQKDEHKILQDLGFTAYTTFVSPTTKNTITLYGKVMNQPEAKAKRPTRRRRRARN